MKMKQKEARGKEKRPYAKKIWLWILMAALVGSSAACGTERSSGNDKTTDEGDGKTAVGAGGEIRSSRRKRKKMRYPVRP